MHVQFSVKQYYTIIDKVKSRFVAFSSMSHVIVNVKCEFI